MQFEPKSKRPTCPNCSKPIILCLCTRLATPKLDNNIHVTILQHSLEKKHPLNSVRIAKIGLRNVDVFNVTDVCFEALFRIWQLGVGGECMKGVCGNDSESLGFDGSVEGAMEAEICRKRVCEADLGVGSVLEIGNDESLMIGNETESLEFHRGVDGEMPQKRVLGRGSEVDLGAGSVIKTRNVEPLMNRNGNGNGNGTGTESLGYDERVEGKMSRKRVFGRVCELDSKVGTFLETQIDEPLMSVEIGKLGKISRVSCQWKLLDESKVPTIEHLVNTREAMECLAGGFIVKKLQEKEKSGSVELEQFEEFEIRVPSGSVLLFPSENAVDVEAIDFEVKNLIVLDGTWSKAKRIYLENPWLRFLPSVRLDVEKMSLYSEVRRQPKEGYLSSIESIVYALEALGETNNLSGLNNLLEVFESMVEDQRRYKHENLTKLSST